MKLPSGHIQSEDQGEESDVSENMYLRNGRKTQEGESGERGTVEPENLRHDSPNWVTVRNPDKGPSGSKTKSKALNVTNRIIVGFLVQYQQIAARARRKGTERRLIFFKKFI